MTQKGILNSVINRHSIKTLEMHSYAEKGVKPAIFEHAFQYKEFYQKEKQISFLAVIHATLYRSQWSLALLVKTIKADSEKLNQQLGELYKCTNKSHRKREKERLP